MYIDTVNIKNYRNFENVNVKLNNGVNIFYGNNANGKTNFLEAVYICSTGRSHRTHNDKELISFSENEAHVQLFINKDSYKNKIDVHLKKDSKKGIAVNNVAIKKLGELFGVLNTVIFSPEDLQLIKEGPNQRRRFMDMEICQINNVYYYDLQQYCKVLKQRNNLLKNIQKNQKLKDTLFVWDEQLVSYGVRLIKSREKFVRDIAETAQRIHFNITGNKERLEMLYKPSVSIDEFSNKLKKKTDYDIFYGTTSYGPHKDDIVFMINDVNARDFGSQGQQRSAALSAKLAELEILKNEKGSSPVLLLDDVLSELDRGRQEYLIDSIKNIQTIITCTGIDDIIKKMAENNNVFFVENGKISDKNNSF